MEHLQHITVEELQEALDRTNKKKPAQRLIAAIAYKNGVTQSELAKWFAVERKTIYNWLNRLEGENLDEAVQDMKRSGRPRKLDELELKKLEIILHNSPNTVGFDAPAWTVPLVRELLRDEFESEYSRPSCRRLMKELGLSYQKPRKAAVETDPEDWEDHEQELKAFDHVWTPN